MPQYEFRNTKTKRIIQKTMKIAEMEKYLEENPHMERYFGTAPAMVRPSLIKGVDSGWKEVLRKVHNSTPGSKLNNTTNI